MRIKRSCSPSQHLKERFRGIRRKIKQMLRESRLKYINSICSSRGKNPTENISMKVSNTERTSANNAVEIANTFNTYFAAIFTHDSDTYDQQQEHTVTDIILEDITLTNDEVIAVLRNLDNNKAHSPDGVPARLLTETAFQIAPSLCALFNKSLRCGILPDDWKLANVVPVHKRGEKSYVENYRPISSLSLISKVLEQRVKTQRLL